MIEPLTKNDVQVMLAPLIKFTKETSFVKGYEATDEEAVGIIISKYFGWDGLAIGETLTHALEDANFKDLCEDVNELLDKEFKSEL